MNLPELQRLEKAATAGPWEAELDYIAGPVPGGRPNGEIIGSFIPSVHRLIDVKQRKANAKFAAAIHDAVRLLEKVQEYAKELRHGHEDTDVIARHILAILGE